MVIEAEGGYGDLRGELALSIERAAGVAAVLVVGRTVVARGVSWSV
jgi:hypothetical protein